MNARISTLSARLLTFTVLLVACCVGSAIAAGLREPGNVDRIGSVLLAIVTVIVAAKLGGELFVRLGQPAVLGELVLGIVIGNVYLTGFHGLEFIKRDGYVEMLSEIGVILLLFQVGLESDLSKMMKVGLSSLAVAFLGVFTPFLLGWGVAVLFMPDAGWCAHVFIGATLSATSVGITARVLMDLGRLNIPEARIILGAAVIDDVLGLIILGVVTGCIRTLACGDGCISALDIVSVVVKATAFLVGAIMLGRWVAPRLFSAAFRMRGSDLVLMMSLAICFLLGYLSRAIGLATIVGAFAAGLILDEVHWRSFTERGERSVDELVKPLVAFLAPIFFVRMGSQVELATFARVEVLGFAAVLTAAAILGKQVCSLGVLQKGLNRLAVGIGMIPRGEVGLIFAAIGSHLVLNGNRIIGPSAFSAIVIMVVITTMITPPALKWSLNRRKYAVADDQC